MDYFSAKPSVFNESQVISNINLDAPYSSTEIIIWIISSWILPAIFIFEILFTNLNLQRKKEFGSWIGKIVVRQAGNRDNVIQGSNTAVPANASTKRKLYPKTSTSSVFPDHTNEDGNDPGPPRKKWDKKYHEGKGFISVKHR